MTAANGPVGVATELRLPLTDPRLEEMFGAIVRHARQRERMDGFSSAEEAAMAYERQDKHLYDEVMARAIDERRFAPPLLEAIREHRDWRHLTHAFHGLDDLARQHRERDLTLYSVAALARSEAALCGATGIVFAQPAVPAIASGRKTVTRMPVEFTRAGKCVPAPYAVNGGEDGTYAVLVSLEPPKDGYEVVPGHRLRIVDVRMERLGEVTDVEARLEGHESRVDLLDCWWDHHGKYPFEWRVWRYEFEPVEL